MFKNNAFSWVKLIIEHLRPKTSLRNPCDRAPLSGLAEKSYTL